MEVITKMSNTIRIKRRGSGGATGAPSSLENAELAFNEADNILYYGKGTGGAGGTATSVEVIGGIGAFTTISTAQTITGNKTFTGTVIVPTPTANTHAVTKAYVDGAVSNASSSFTAAADSGVSQVITSADTFTISGGVGLSSVGSNTDTITLNLDNTAVTAGTYGNAKAAGTFTVDAQGRITSASNTAIALEYWEIANFASGVSNNISNAVYFGNKAFGVIANYNAGTDGIDFSLDSTFSPTFAGLTINSSSIVFEGATADAFETTLAVVDPTADRTITLPNVTGTVVTTGDTGSITSAMIADGTIATADLANAAVTATKLANTTVTAGSYGGAGTVGGFTVDAQGRLTAASNTAISITASQISDRATNLVTGLTGTANEITVSNSGVGAVTLSLPSNVTISNNLTVTGDLTVQGNTVTLNTATLTVEDKNIVLSNVASPTNTTADGAGLTVLGTTDKTFNWVNATAAWTSSEDLNLLSGKVFEISGTTVLSSNALGSGIVSSSLTSLGTIGTGVWNGTAIGAVYGGTGLTSYTTGDLVYASATNTLAKAAIGTAGQFLKVVGGVPAWSDTVDGGTF